jgi:hypothetical protein
MARGGPCSERVKQCGAIFASDVLGRPSKCATPHIANRPLRENMPHCSASLSSLTTKLEHILPSSDATHSKKPLQPQKHHSHKHNRRQLELARKSYRKCTKASLTEIGYLQRPPYNAHIWRSLALEPAVIKQ